MAAATLVLPAAGVAYASGNGNVTGNGNVSVLSGNTLDAPISLPVNLCGVSLGIVGFANSDCKGGAVVNPPNPPGCQRNAWRLRRARSKAAEVMSWAASGSLVRR